MMTGKQNKQPSSQVSSKYYDGRPALQPICPQQMPQQKEQKSAVLVRFPAYHDMPTAFEGAISDGLPSSSFFFTTGTTLPPPRVPSQTKSVLADHPGFPPGTGPDQPLSSFETAVVGGHVVFFF